MRKAGVYFKEEEVGNLIQHDEGSFTFRYNDDWMMNNDKPSISLTFPKNQQEYNSNFLFPFFYNMLPEGTNKQVVCKYNKIDSDDYFGLLMITAKNDSIGAVRIVKIESV